MTRLLALALAVMATPAFADTAVTLNFAYAEPGATPTPRVQVTNLLTDQPIEVTEAEGDPGHKLVTVAVKDSDFAGPYARLRLAVSGLHLPSDDAKSDQEMTFATELLLRRDMITDPVVIEVPVAVSSRKGAIKPAMEMPQIAEETPGRYFMAQEYASLYTVSAEDVAAAPESFALHRLIARALADFALAMGQAKPGPVQLVPAEEMQATIKLFWASQPNGLTTHLRAYQEARTALWLDLANVQSLLIQARRAGVEGPGLCAKAKDLLDFFDAHRPADTEAKLVDLIFPNPGTLDGYIQGRRLDYVYSCARPQI